MHKHELGEIPAARNYGNDNRLVYEAGAVLRGAIANSGRRWMAGGGLHINQSVYDWLKDHLDEDAHLTDRVLLEAGFVKKHQHWVVRKGAFSLTKAVDLTDIGDLLADLVDVHRPI